jgi:hypothetical protein
MEENTSFRKENTFDNKDLPSDSEASASYIVDSPSASRKTPLTMTQTLSIKSKAIRHRRKTPHPVAKQHKPVTNLHFSEISLLAPFLTLLLHR